MLSTTDGKGYQFSIKKVFTAILYPQISLCIYVSFILRYDILDQFSRIERIYEKKVEQSFDCIPYILFLLAAVIYHNTFINFPWHNLGFRRIVWGKINLNFLPCIQSILCTGKPIHMHVYCAIKC